MRKEILQITYLPHYFIQGNNVSPLIEDMDLNKKIRLQIYNSDATKVIFDNILTKEEINNLNQLRQNKKDKN